jgi:type IV secretion system protein VirD4
MTLLLGWQTQRDGGFGFAPPSHVSKSLAAYDGEAHLITVAPTGAGNGKDVIIPNALTYTGPMILMDPKRELYAVTARGRREMGHHVVRLDPFGDSSDALNPLEIFDLAGADVACDAQMLGELISLAALGAKEPFWDISASALCSGVTPPWQAANCPRSAIWWR